MLRSVQGSVLLIILLLPIFAMGQFAPREEGVFGIESGNPLPVDILPPVDKLFESDQLLKVRIETNLQKLYQFKYDPEYQKATFTIEVADTMFVVKKIKVKVRGKTRVTICDDPPLKINFKKTDFEWEWFDKLKSLKIVTPCDDPKLYSKYLMKEYFAYLSFNIFSDVSYQVRYIELTISDKQQQIKEEVKYAFLVENDRKLAKRTGTKEVELDDTTAGAMAYDLYVNPTDQTLFNLNVMSLFQYMIGNTDYTASLFHNMKIFKNGDTIFPVPYDFDYSGLVDANYAIPSKSAPIGNVKERYYLGPCSDQGSFEKAVNYVLSKKPELMQRLNEDSYISTKVKDEIREYIESFYSLISDPVHLESIRVTHCIN